MVSPGTGRRIKPVDLTKIDLEAGTPREVWRRFFATHRPGSARLSDLVLRLHKQDKHQHVIAAINEALIQGQAEPWMYDVLALTMKIAGRPTSEIERVLLSRIDFSAVDVPSMLYSAAYLTRFGASAQALLLYRQASRLSPARPEPYALGLRLAVKLQDHDAIEWAATGTLTCVWSEDYQRRHDAALDAASDAESLLRKAGQSQRADRMVAAIAAARQRDLVLTLTWNGAGELDLQVEEPLGTICHFDNRQTRSGGALVHDGFGPVQRNCYEKYVCAFGAKGEYRVVINHVTGDIVGKRATLTVRRYLGTADEQVHSHPVVLDSRRKVVRVSLQQGRREKLEDAVPKVDSSFHQARRGRGRPFRLGPSESSRQARARRREAGVGYTPLVSFVSEGVANTALAVVSGDRRYVRLTINSVFTSIVEMATFSFRR